MILLSMMNENDTNNFNDLRYLIDKFNDKLLFFIIYFIFTKLYEA